MPEVQGRSPARCLAAFAAVALLLAAGGEASATLLRNGDLVLLDSLSGRVLRVRPQTGDVALVTPRPGRPAILTNAVDDMAIAPDGRIFLVSPQGLVVSADPATGEQSLVAAAPDGGTSPQPLQTGEASSLGFDGNGNLFVYLGYSVRTLSWYARGPFGVLIGPHLYSTLPAGFDDGRSLSIGRTVEGAPGLFFVAGRSQGLRRIQTTGTTLSYPGIPGPTAQTVAVEAIQPCLPELACFALVLETVALDWPLHCAGTSVRIATLVNGVAGVDTRYERAEPDNTCALSMAAAPIEPPSFAPNVVYLATGRPLVVPEAQIDRLVDTGSGWTRQALATIAPSHPESFAAPIRMAVWTLPEPGAGLAGLAALASLAALAPRRSADRRTLPSRRPR